MILLLLIFCYSLSFNVGNANQSNRNENQNFILNRKISLDDGCYKGFECALKLLNEKENPVIIKSGLGCDRNCNSLPKGYSTLVFAKWVKKNNGKLFVVDPNGDSIKKSKKRLKKLKHCVVIVESNSVDFLQTFNKPIDFLYLDSENFDSNDPISFQESYLKEVIAAYPYFFHGSVVMIDDCNDQDYGRGKLAIEYLLARGWKILLDGRQVILKPGRPGFHSQASQDEFVYILLYDLLKKKNKGYYLEIGAWDPVIINNSYCLEKNCNWNGVSIDISNEFVESWKGARKNSLRIEDALESDYASMLQTFPKVVDYLSLDVDGYYDVVLEKILLTNHIFKIVTIEHDYYRYGEIYRDKERQILSSYGYHLLCPDVNIGDFGSFEDWWIHPSAFPLSLLSKLTCLDLSAKDNRDIIKSIKNLSAE